MCETAPSACARRDWEVPIAQAMCVSEFLFGFSLLQFLQNPSLETNKNVVQTKLLNLQPEGCLVELTATASYTKRVIEVSLG